MSEKTTGFKQTDDHLRDRQPAPQSTPSMHQTPLYIFMTPEKHSGNLLTLPGGNLLHGVRSMTAPITDASHIIRRSGITFTPKAAGFVHDSESRDHGYAFLVEPAWHSKLPKPVDYTGSKRFELIPATPQPHPDAPVELHHWTSLLARMQHLNYRRSQLNKFRDDESKLPLHEAEEALLRSFGRHLLNRTIH